MRLALTGAALALIFSAGYVAANDYATLYAAGTAARLEGSFVEAEAALLKALELDPGDPDALVQLGFARLGVEDFTGARDAFRQALAGAPGYVDARRGLARGTLLDGHADEAAVIYQELLDVSPAGEDYLGLGDAHRAAGREGAARAAYRTALGEPAIAEDARRRLADPDFLRSRLDLDVSASDLEGSAEDWREGTLRLTRRLSPDASLTAGAEVARRYGETDVFVDLRFDRRFSEKLNGYAWIGGTQDADFRPNVAVGFGGTARLRNGDAHIGATDGAFSLRHDVYSASAVTALQAGFDQGFAGDRLRLGARVIGTYDDAGDATRGWSLRANVALSDRIDVFAGYSDAPEVEAGIVTGVRSSFVGASFALTDTTGLRVTYAEEDRSSGSDRLTLTVGMTLRF